MLAIQLIESLACTVNIKNPCVFSKCRTFLNVAAFCGSLNLV